VTKTIERPGIVPPSLPEVDDATRREFLIGAAGLLLLPVGCGSDGENGRRSSGETRTVRHAFGETEIPWNPQRVVVLDYEVLENAVAVGVEPGGTPDPGWVGLPDFLTERVGDLPSIGNIGAPNFERVAEQEPDLIVGIAIDGFTEENHDTLSEIAPTVAMARADGSQAEWKRTFGRTADLFGRREEARDALREYERRAEELRRRLDDPEEAEVSVARFYADGRAEYRTGESFPVSVLEDVGLVIPEAQEIPEGAEDGGFVVIGEERIDLLDADAIFVASDPGSEATQERYRNGPLWKRLRAVREGRVYEVAGAHWIFGSILAAGAILDDLERYLLLGEGR